MKNAPDFLKINGGKWGVINFNNMIPVHPSCLSKIDLNILPNDGNDEKKYKYLLRNQLSWCTANRSRILSKAVRLHGMMVSGAGVPSLRGRCCDFSNNEKLCKEYEPGCPRPENTT
jgi:protein AbiQ